MTWQSSVSMFVGRVSCPDANTLVSPSSVNARASSIDRFYAATHQTLTQIPPTFFPDIWR